MSATMPHTNPHDLNACNACGKTKEAAGGVLLVSRKSTTVQGPLGPAHQIAHERPVCKECFDQDK